MAALQGEIADIIWQDSCYGHKWERIDKSRATALFADARSRTSFQYSIIFSFSFSFFFFPSLFLFFWSGRFDQGSRWTVVESHTTRAPCVRSHPSDQSHNDALSAAASVFARLAHVHLAFWSSRTKCARSGWVRRHFFVVSANLTNKVVEGVFNVETRLCRSFDEFAAELLSQVFTLCRKGKD